MGKQQSLGQTLRDLPNNLVLYTAPLWEVSLFLQVCDRNIYLCQCNVKNWLFWSVLISAGTFQIRVLWRNGSPGPMQFLCCGCTKRWPTKRTALSYPRVISLMLEHLKSISDPAGKDWATTMKCSFAEMCFYLHLPTMSFFAITSKALGFSLWKEAELLLSAD